MQSFILLKGLSRVNFLIILAIFDIWLWESGSVGSPESWPKGADSK